MLYLVVPILFGVELMGPSSPPWLSPIAIKLPHQASGRYEAIFSA